MESEHFHKSSLKWTKTLFTTTTFLGNRDGIHFIFQYNKNFTYYNDLQCNFKRNEIEIMFVKVSLGAIKVFLYNILSVKCLLILLQFFFFGNLLFSCLKRTIITIGICLQTESYHHYTYL